MHSGETRMTNEQFANVDSKRDSPLWIERTNARSIWPTNPGQHAKTFECVEEFFHLLRIGCRQCTVGFCWTKVWKDIGDVIAAKFFSNRAEIFATAIFLKLVRLRVLNEPIIRSEPSMRDPDAVAATIISTVLNVETGLPHEIDGRRDQEYG